MPPRLVDYQISDWLRLRPVTHGLKTLRYRQIDRKHRGKPARAGDLSEIVLQIKDRRVLVAIAFNDAQTIRWQAILVRHFVPVGGLPFLRMTTTAGGALGPGGHQGPARIGRDFNNLIRSVTSRLE